MYITVCTNGDHLFLLVWETLSFRFSCLRHPSTGIMGAEPHLACVWVLLCFSIACLKEDRLSLFCVEFSGPGFVAVLLPVPHCAGLWVFITKSDYIWFLNGSFPHQMSYQQN